MNNWSQTTVGQIAAPTRNALVGGPFGSNLVSRDYVVSGTPVIRGQNMEGRWISGDFVFVSQEKARALAVNTARPGDVVFTQRGTLGQVALVPAGPFESYIISQSQMKLTVDPTKADPLYVYYAFQSPEQQEYIRQNAIQVGVPHTNLGILRDTPISLPPLDLQRDIAGCLGALDDKIELNRRTSETLEAMARALFQSWFDCLAVQHISVDQAIRDGWLEIGDGYRAKNSELGHAGLPFVRAGDLIDGFQTATADRLRAEYVERAANKRSRVGDVAFTSKGTIGRLAQVTGRTEPFVYSPQICFWRSLDPGRCAPALLYCWMRSADFETQVAAAAGQTDMAPYVSLRDQRRMLVPTFPDARQDVAVEVQALLSHAAAFTAESRTLATCRDALLPRFLSGEISPLAARA